MNFRTYENPRDMIWYLGIDISRVHSSLRDISKKDMPLIDQVYQKWATRNKILDALNWINTYPSVPPKHDDAPCSPSLSELFSVGMLGVARLKVHHLNTLLTTDQKIDTQQIQDKLDEVQHTVYDLIKPDTLPSSTLNHFPLNWWGEIQNDTGLSLEKLGKIDEAIELHRLTMKRLEKTLNDSHRTKAPIQLEPLWGDQSLREKLTTLFTNLPQMIDYQAENKNEAATLSALAAHTAHLGRLTNSPQLGWRGLLQQRASMRVRPDHLRLDECTRIAAKVGAETMLSIRLEYFPSALLSLSYAILKASTDIGVKKEYAQIL